MKRAPLTLSGFAAEEGSNGSDTRELHLQSNAALVVQSDCIAFMNRLPANCFDMVFADPPFNIGQDYAGYVDRVKELDFRRFVFDYVVNAWRVCNGALCLHGPDNLVAIYLECMRDIPRLAWVNWCYSFGQYTGKNWTNGREHCLIYAKHGAPLQTFNAEAVSIPSVRMLIGDKRAAGYRVPSNVWGIKYSEDELTPLEPIQNEEGWNRVQGNNKERQPERPNQLPLAYLKRLIKAYTNKDGLVFDPFCGTGTTALAAVGLGRTAITCDLDPQAVAVATRRIMLAGFNVFTL